MTFQIAKSSFYAKALTGIAPPPHTLQELIEDCKTIINLNQADLLVIFTEAQNRANSKFRPCTQCSNKDYTVDSSKSNKFFIGLVPVRFSCCGCKKSWNLLQFLIRLYKWRASSATSTSAVTSHVPATASIGSSIGSISVGSASMTVATSRPAPPAALTLTAATPPAPDTRTLTLDTQTLPLIAPAAELDTFNEPRPSSSRTDSTNVPTNMKDATDEGADMEPQTQVLVTQAQHALDVECSSVINDLIINDSNRDESSASLNHYPDVGCSQLDMEDEAASISTLSLPELSTNITRRPKPSRETNDILQQLQELKAAYAVLQANNQALLLENENLKLKLQNQSLALQVNHQPQVRRETNCQTTPQVRNQPTPQVNPDVNHQANPQVNPEMNTSANRKHTSTKSLDHPSRRDGIKILKTLCAPRKPAPKAKEEVTAIYVTGIKWERIKVIWSSLYAARFHLRKIHKISWIGRTVVEMICDVKYKSTLSSELEEIGYKVIEFNPVNNPRITNVAQQQQIKKNFVARAVKGILTSRSSQVKHYFTALIQKSDDSTKSLFEIEMAAAKAATISPNNDTAVTTDEVGNGAN